MWESVNNTTISETLLYKTIFSSIVNLKVTIVNYYTAADYDIINNKNSVFYFFTGMRIKH